MRNKFKNEQGYALIVVVLLIVLIMGFFTAFMTISLSNAKQEQVADQEHLKVAAAEMGVKYFSSIFINEYYHFINELDLNQLTESESGLNAEELYYRVQEQVVNNLLDRMTATKLSLAAEEQHVKKDDYFYQLLSIDDIRINEDDLLVIDGRVAGNKTGSDRPAELSFTQVIDVPFIGAPYTGEPPVQTDPAPGGSLIDINVLLDLEFGNYGVTRPEGLCLNLLNLLGLGDLLNLKCILPGSISYINNSPLNLLSGALLYTNHHLTINNKIQITDSQLHSEKQLTIGNHPLNLLNSIVYSENELQANQGINLSGNSTVYVGNNDANIANRNSLINQSKLVVSDHLNVTGNASLSVENGSNLIIGKQINMQNNDLIVDDSNVYAGNNLDLRGSGSLRVEGGSNVSIDGRIDIQNGDLIIKGSNVYTGNDVELPVGTADVDHQSSLYIDGHLKIRNQGRLSVKGNSRVCITKQLSIAATSLYIEQGSFVYVGGNGNTPSHPWVIKKTESEMKKLCNLSAENEEGKNPIEFETLEPQNIGIDVNYN